MSKITKEFWVSDEFLEDNKNIGMLGLSRRKTPYFRHLITISYEIDREIKIKESDLENAFKDIYISGHSVIDMGVMDKVKKKLFGGGEND